jgi:glycerophosphoryl diester phosphodiesterase
VPVAASHPFLDHDGPLPIVHRGGALEARENTLAAFEQAVGAGFRYIETDVRVTADGVLVAFHDATLGRVTDRDGRIDQLPWSEVTQARIGGREPIPRLSDLLELFPDVCFNLDAKQDATLRPLARLLRHPGLLDRVCLASFSHRRLRWLRTALGPGACTSLGPAEIVRLKRASQTGRNGALPWLAPNALAVQVPAGPALLPLVDARFVRTAHEKGLAVHVWTVDEEAEMDRLLDLGVDGIMTDRPGRLKAVLVRRGQWSGPAPPAGDPG